jgi:hypothetical protein
LIYARGRSRRPRARCHQCRRHDDDSADTRATDAGDRRRLTEATGKDYPESIPASVEILDVLDSEQA